MDGGLQNIPLKDIYPVAGRNAVRDLGGEGLVVHQQELELVHVVHEELFEPVGQQVAGLPVRSIPDLK